MKKYEVPVTMNSMFQVETEEHTSSESSSLSDNGWAKLTWYFSIGFFCVISLPTGPIGPLLIMIILSRVSQHRVRLDGNKKKMNRYYLISALIFLVLTSWIISPFIWCVIQPGKCQ